MDCICLWCGGAISPSRRGPTASVCSPRCRGRLRRWREWLRARLRGEPWQRFTGRGWPAVAYPDPELRSALALTLPGATPPALGVVVLDGTSGRDPREWVRSLVVIQELGRELSGAPWRQAARLASSELRGYLS